MEKTENAGFIYIFSKSDQDGLIKVGKTNKNPMLRAEQLSKQTASSGVFKVEWYFEVPNIDIAENIVHFKLKEYHYNKEYFKIPLNEAKILLTKELIIFFKLENAKTHVFWEDNNIIKCKEINILLNDKIFVAEHIAIDKLKNFKKNSV